MDKKSQKQHDLLRAKLQTMQRQLAGAKKQCDDPSEVVQLEKDIAKTQAEMKRLEGAG
jgi:hypothetical protein